MKHYIKQITWRFQEAAETNPQLKNRKIKVTSPADIVDNFRFYSTGR